MIALTLLIVVLSGLLTHADGSARSEDQRNLFGNGGVALIFSALAGVLLVTSEYRYGTIRPTFLFTPRRSRVLSAKLTAGLLAGLVLRRGGRRARARDRLADPLRPAASRQPSTAARSRCSWSAGSPESLSGARSASGSARSSATRSAR